MTHRPATNDDALALTQLYQECAAPARDDPVMLDVRLLANLIAAPDGAWFVAVRDGRPDAVVAFLVDGEHQLCKISRRAEAGSGRRRCGRAWLQAGPDGRGTRTGYSPLDLA